MDGCSLCDFLEMWFVTLWSKVKRMPNVLQRTISGWDAPIRGPEEQTIPNPIFFFPSLSQLCVCCWAAPNVLRVHEESSNFSFHEHISQRNIHIYIVFISNCSEPSAGSASLQDKRSSNDVITWLNLNPCRMFPVYWIDYLFWLASFEKNTRDRQYCWPRSTYNGPNMIELIEKVKQKANGTFPPSSSVKYWHEIFLSMSRVASTRTSPWRFITL